MADTVETTSTAATSAATMTSATDTPGGADWRTGIQDESLRSDPSLASFKDVGALAKSYIETKKMVGQRGDLKLPDEKATPEERQAFAATLRKYAGVPEDPKDYKYQRPDVAIDGAWDEAAEQQFLASAHKAGLNNAQVQQVMGWYGQFVRAGLEKARAEATEVGAKLRQEWGANYDAYLGRANRAVQEFGGDALVEYLAASGLGRHPLMVQAWAKVGNALVEHGAMTGATAPAYTKAEADARTAELRGELAKLPDAHPRRSQLIEEIIAVTNAGQRGR